MDINAHKLTQDITCIHGNTLSNDSEFQFLSDIEQEQAAVTNLKMAEKMAASYAVAIGMPALSKDLSGVAQLALVKATKRYNKNREVPFSFYAMGAIKREMIDFLRDEDVLTRDQRRLLKKIMRNGPEAGLASPASVEDAIQHLPSATVETKAMLKNAARHQLNGNGLVVSLDTVYRDEKGKEGYYDVSGEHNSPEELAIKNEETTRLQQSLATLRPSYSSVLKAHFLEEKEIEEIGREKNITPGRVRQLKKAGLETLRAKAANAGWSI